MESVVFIFSLIDCCALIFLSVYFIITLSDLECDYINARSCCSKLNKWVVPEVIGHAVVTVLMLISLHWFIFLLNLPVATWNIYRYIMVPCGNMGVFDPTEIHNRGQLKSHMKEAMIKLGFHLLCFFMYLYRSTFSEATFATMQFKSRASSISTTAQYTLDNEDTKEQLKEEKKDWCTVVFTSTHAHLYGSIEILKFWISNQEPCSTMKSGSHWTGGAALQSYSIGSGQRVKYGLILDILLSFPGKYHVSTLNNLISSQFELHSTNSDCLHTPSVIFSPAIGLNLK
ncbi:protein cornichon homolog 4 isoform 1-T1 [Amazona ochrocephala]